MATKEYHPRLRIAYNSCIWRVIKKDIAPLNYLVLHIHGLRAASQSWKGSALVLIHKLNHHLSVENSVPADFI